MKYSVVLLLVTSIFSSAAFAAPAPTHHYRHSDVAYGDRNNYGEDDYEYAPRRHYKRSDDDDEDEEDEALEKRGIFGRKRRGGRGKKHSFLKGAAIGGLVSKATGRRFRDGAFVGAGVQGLRNMRRKKLLGKRDIDEDSEEEGELERRSPRHDDDEHMHDGKEKHHSKTEGALVGGGLGLLAGDPVTGGVAGAVVQAIRNHNKRSDGAVIEARDVHEDDDEHDDGNLERRAFTPKTFNAQGQAVAPHHSITKGAALGTLIPIPGAGTLSGGAVQIFRNLRLKSQVKNWNKQNPNGINGGVAVPGQT